VLAYGLHDLQEAGWIGGLNSLAFDITSTIPKDSWYGTLLKGVFNFQADPTVLQLCAWAAYLVPTLAFFLRGATHRPAPSAPAPAESSTAGTAS
jgi:high-affinity iron transporter